MKQGKILVYLVMTVILLLVVVPLIALPAWRATVWDALGSGYHWIVGGEAQAEAGFYYTCPMHPQIKLPQAGDCPICGMSLVKKEASQTTEDSHEIVLTPTQIQLTGIRSEPVQSRHLVKEIDTVGRIAYDERKMAYVSAWVAGRIDELFVDFTGVTIQAGHALASLYSPQLISTQEEYLRAIKTLNEASTSQIPETVTSAENLVKATRQRLIWWGVTEEQIDELAKTQKAPSHLVIKAPIGGTVIHKNALAGMYVKEGTQLFKIVDMSSMWLYADIYESEIPLVMTPQAGDYYQCPMHPEIKQDEVGNCSICGMPLVRHSPNIQIEITTEAYPEDIFTGQIGFTDPFVNPRTRTLRVRCSIDNSDLKLRADMYARARIFIDVGETLALPENAVIRSGKRNIIMVDKGDGLFEPRLVRLGRQWLYEKDRATTEVTALPFHRGMQRYHEILAGLKTDEKVVSPASFLLNSEAQIQGALEKFIEAEPEAKPVDQEESAVCAWDGMKMKLSAFQSTMEHEGKTSYFCTEKEMEQFMKEPEKSYFAILNKYSELMNKIIKDYLVIRASLASDNTESVAESASRMVDNSRRAAGLIPESVFKSERGKLVNLANDMTKTIQHISQHATHIEMVRNHFRQLSNLLITYVDGYKTRTSVPALIKFFCPMEKGGYWLQGTEEMGNPYYGQEMLKCGEKVE